MKKSKLSGLFILLAGLLLSACQPSPNVDIPPVGDAYAYGQDATVESLEVLLLESFPLQARAIVSGYLPDGCTELDEITVEHQGQNFVLSLITRRPTGDVMCTQALVPFEETVDLEIRGLEAGTYRVIAQEQEATFPLEVDNVPPRALEENDFSFGSAAVVENLSLDVKESEVGVMLVGYLPDGCTEIHEITSALDEQTFIIEIITRRPTGDVMCTQALVPFEQKFPLVIEDLPAGEYTVRSGELSETFVID